MSPLLKAAFFTPLFLISGCSEDERESPAIAGKAETSLEGRRISEVVYRLDRPDVIEPARLKNFTQTRTGKFYSIEQIDDDIRGLYLSGLIDDLRVLAEPEGDAVRLIYEIDVRQPSGLEGPFLVGNSAFSDNTLAKHLSKLIPPGEAVPSLDVLEEGRQQLLKFYQDHGYSECHIELSAWNGGPATIDDSVFRIDEGTRSGSLQEP